MFERYRLTVEQMVRLRPVFPRSFGTPRDDDEYALSGLICINRNGLRSRDAPPEFDSAKDAPHPLAASPLGHRERSPLVNESNKRVFARMMAGLADKHGEWKIAMIDATYLRAHRRAAGVHAKLGGMGD